MDRPDLLLDERTDVLLIAVHNVGLVERLLPGSRIEVRVHVAIVSAKRGPEVVVRKVEGVH